MTPGYDFHVVSARLYHRHAYTKPFGFKQSSRDALVLTTRESTTEMTSGINYLKHDEVLNSQTLEQTNEKCFGGVTIPEAPIGMRDKRHHGWYQFWVRSEDHWLDRIKRYKEVHL